MGQKNPIVSVIIPTYNRVHLLGRAIRSVLTQTYQDFEIVVVDDGSTDNIEDVVRSFNDRRIKYIRHEKNKGGAVARNTGIKAARSKYIAFLDSDDEWLSDKLKQQIECLENSEEKVGVVYCESYSQDDNSGFIQEPPPNPDLYTGDVYKYLLGGWCPVSTSLFLVDHQLLVKVGLFDPSLPSFQDYDLWLRLAQICYFEVVQVPLVIKHSHAGIQIARDPKNRYKALNIFMEKWKPVMRKEVGSNVAREVRRKHLTSIYANAVLVNIKQGNRSEAIKNFLRYIKITKKINPNKSIGLFIALIGGISAYEFLESRWRQWKQKKKEWK